MNEINKLIETAKAEVGYLEKKSNSQLDSKTANAGVGNYTKYARDLDAISGFYNGKKQGFAWCDVFVDWCFVQSFGADRAKELLLQPNKSLGAGCKYSMNYYKNAKQFYTTPKAGDQIFFKSGGSIFHTGLVIKADNEYVYTIEGNTSNSEGVDGSGGGVYEKRYKLGYKYIAGYGRPKYKEEPAPTPSKPKTEEIKVEGAESFNKKYRFGKTYKTTTDLNFRAGAGTDKAIIGVLTKGTKVKWYGYYTGGWKLVKATSGANKGKTGYCSGNYLK